MEAGIFVCEYVCFHISEGSLRFVFDAVEEGLQDILFEINCTRERLHDRVAVRVWEAGVVDSEHIHFDACRQEGNDRMHVLRDAGSRVKCNRCPYVLDVLFRDVMAAEEIARSVRSINFETVCVATVRRYEADVMEHSARVKKFSVELETMALTSECAKIVNAAGVIEKQSRFCIADELRDFVGKFTVGNCNARDECCLRSLSGPVTSRT